MTEKWKGENIIVKFDWVCIRQVKEELKGFIFIILPCAFFDLSTSSLIHYTLIALDSFLSYMIPMKSDKLILVLYWYSNSGYSAKPRENGKGRMALMNIGYTKLKTHMI